MVSILRDPTITIPAPLSNSTSTPVSASSPRWASPTDLVLFLSRETLDALCKVPCFAAKFLCVYSYCIRGDTILTTLVHNFPASLESFALLLADYDGELASETWKQNGIDLQATVSTLLGTVKGFTDPLSRMTEWRVMITGEVYVSPDLLASLLQLFPELTSLDLPMYDFIDPEIYKSFAERVLQSCPKLKHLSRRGPGPDEGRMMSEFLNSMEDTLESIHFLKYSKATERAVWSLHRHAESVKSIIFDECQPFSSSYLSGIFGFPMLEVLRISLDLWSDSHLTLDEIVCQQWSTKFQELRLHITLDKAEDKGKIGFSDSILFWRNLLEQFYRQIGALTNLRILDLRVAVEKNTLDSNGRRIIYSDKTFVGMLSLEGWITDYRPGHLQLLEGLGNLEELRGSFNLDAMEPGLEFGQDEADWIVEHWPKLKFIEFYTQLEKTPIVFPPTVQSMIERLPGLQVVSQYTNPLWD